MDIQRTGNMNLNLLNARRQEINRIKSSIQKQMRMNQTIDTAGGPYNGYRSLGFYQLSRNTTGSGNHLVVGGYPGSGNLVS